MLIKTLSRVALSSALILAFSGCGSDDSGTDFDDSATTEETVAMADDAADAAAQAAGAMNFGGPSIFIGAPAAFATFIAKHPAASRSVAGVDLATSFRSVTSQGAGLQLSASVGCTVTGHGADGDNPFEPYDGNENGIPDDWYLKMVCVSKDSSDTANVVTTTVVQVYSGKENGASLYGWDATVAYNVSSKGEDGDWGTLEIKGAEKLDIRTGSVGHRRSFAVRSAGLDGDEVVETSGGTNWDASFDPDGSIALGDPLPDGDLEFTGKDWYAATDEVSLSFILDTPMALAYNAACYAADDDPPFSSGQIRGRLNGGSSSASFIVTMNTCGTYTVVTDHTSDEPVVVTAQR